jgi:hypothetical protein
MAHEVPTRWVPRPARPRPTASARARPAPRTYSHGNANCTCAQTAEGDGFCHLRSDCGVLEDDFGICTTTADCPAGYRCLVATCCEVQVCAPPCPT